MNVPLVGAASLAVLLGAAHSVLGERYILMRLFRRADLPKLFGSDIFTRRTLRFAWHLTTVVWWGVAALLLVAAQARSATLSVGQVGLIVAGTAAASSVVTFVGSRGRHLAWLVFSAIALLVWLGSR